MNTVIDSINKKITINAPIETVWQTITEPRQLSQWFGDTAQFELEVGALGWFGWKEHGQFALRIEAITEPNYFAWRWMAKKDQTFSETDSTLVEWRLESLTFDTTEVYLCESGFKSPQSRADNVSGWKEELTHLVEYFAQQ